MCGSARERALWSHFFCLTLQRAGVGFAEVAHDSERLFAEACADSGGVKQPVRAWAAVGGTRSSPAARGRRSSTPTGKRTDFVGSWGPLISGSASRVVAAWPRRPSGTSFGAPRHRIGVGPAAVEASVVEQVRLVSSGTEATMSGFAWRVRQPVVIAS